MRLAFCLFKYYPFGGLEQSFLNIAIEAIKQGFVVDVYTMKWEGDIPNGLNVITVQPKGLSNHRRAFNYSRQIKPLLDQGNYDLVVGFKRMPHLDLYYNGDVCFINDMAKRRSPLLKLSSRYKIYSQFEEVVFSKNSNTHIMYIAEAEKKHYIDAYATLSERFHFLPPGLSKKRIKDALLDESRKNIREEFNIFEAETLLLMVGSDFARKGVHRTIEALSKLPEDQKNNTKLIVVGNGKKGKLQHQIEQQGLGAQIIFAGVRKDVPKFLAAADYLIHPAINETAGNAIIEALVAGLPVLVTKSCGFSHHVSDADAGMVFDDETFEQNSFNAALSKLIGSSKYKKWHVNALAYAEKTDLYSRPGAAVNIIKERLTRKHVLS